MYTPPDFNEARNNRRRSHVQDTSGPSSISLPKSPLRAASNPTAPILLYLTSKNSSENIFTSSEADLNFMLDSHHIQRDAHLTLANRLVNEQASKNPAVAIFHDLDVLPKGSLLALAQAREHLGRGACMNNESSATHLACSSIHTQFNVPDPAWLDPNTRLQVNQLRSRLNGYLHLLVTGKLPEDDITSLDKEARQERIEARVSLQAQWPQLVPDRLKHRLLQMFNYEISSDALATFLCGSCAELCPLVNKTTVDLDKFVGLLSRPDCRPVAEYEVSAERMDVDVDAEYSEDEEEETVIVPLRDNKGVCVGLACPVNASCDVIERLASVIAYNTADMGGMVQSCWFDVSATTPGAVACPGLFYVVLASSDTEESSAEIVKSGVVFFRRDVEDEVIGAIMRHIMDVLANSAVPRALGPDRGGSVYEYRALDTDYFMTPLGAKPGIRAHRITFSGCILSLTRSANSSEKAIGPTPVARIVLGLPPNYNADALALVVLQEEFLWEISVADIRDADAVGFPICYVRWGGGDTSPTVIIDMHYPKSPMIQLSPWVYDGIGAHGLHEGDDISVLCCLHRYETVDENGGLEMSLLAVVLVGRTPLCEALLRSVEEHLSAAVILSLQMLA
ncbi:hypothetical protein DFH09DRAFT_1085198 [Mycena vulgaris]|nr:hypothetical protein DFH09DRAFT_1085198 [Mycena vulgaris]